MVNMYSMGGYGSMGYGAGMGMGSSMNSNGNVYQNFKNKYGCGYEDFGAEPYRQPYPFAINPKGDEPCLKKSWLGRLVEKYFNEFLA